MESANDPTRSEWAPPDPGAESDPIGDLTGRRVLTGTAREISVEVRRFNVQPGDVLDVTVDWPETDRIAADELVEALAREVEPLGARAVVHGTDVEMDLLRGYDIEVATSIVEESGRALADLAQLFALDDRERRAVEEVARLLAAAEVRLERASLRHVRVAFYGLGEEDTRAGMAVARQLGALLSGSGAEALVEGTGTGEKVLWRISLGGETFQEISEGPDTGGAARCFGQVMARLDETRRFLGTGSRRFPFVALVAALPGDAVLRALRDARMDGLIDRVSTPTTKRKPAPGGSERTVLRRYPPHLDAVRVLAGHGNIKQAAYEVDCPRCGAPRGFLCVKLTYQRGAPVDSDATLISPHGERWGRSLEARRR